MFHSFAASMSTYQNCKLMNNQYNYRLYWNVSTPYIYFGVQANSLGWVALGLSLNGQMNSGGVAPGSDIMMGYKNPSDSNCPNGCIHDYYTLFYQLPSLDATQNVELLYYQEGSFQFSNHKNTIL